MKSKFLTLCLLKKPKLLVISPSQIQNVKSLRSYNLESISQVGVFQEDVGKIEEIVSLLSPDLPTTLIYANSYNFSEVMQLPWALRQEVPIYGMNLVAFSFFNGRFVISVINEVGYETEEYIYPYYLIPYYGAGGTARAFRNLTYVPVESPYYPGLYFKPENLTHYMWEWEMSEFKQCNYGRLTDLVKKHG